MSKCIVYTTNGNQVIISPALNCGLTIEQIAEKDVPKGISYEIVYSSEIKPVVTKEQKLAKIRAERDKLLDDVIWMVDRHKQQLELVQNNLLVSPTLTTRTYFQLLTYIQELRDIPNKDLDLANPVYPKKPAV